MQFKDGRYPKILDILKIRLKCRQPNYYQKENYIFDDQCYWAIIGHATIKQVLEIHPPEYHDALFYNYDKRVSDSEIESVEDCSRYSLALIHPTDIVIQIKLWSGQKYPSIYASFTYGNRKYKYLKITDPEFNDQYESMPEGDYKLNDAYFVTSLADNFSLDGNHYKLIATVITNSELKSLVPDIFADDEFPF